jgi:hypothetical protein
VVRYGAKYFATNRLTLPAAEVRRLYRVRSQIREVIRVYKDQLGLSGCQARSARARVHHVTRCVAAFYVLERERHDRGLASFKRKPVENFPHLSHLMVCGWHRWGYAGKSISCWENCWDFPGKIGLIWAASGKWQTSKYT